MDHPQLARLIEVMATLRQACPWDAQQTHESLAQYLIEETAETIEAIETGVLAAESVDLRGLVEYHESLEPVSLADLKVVRVVPRRWGILPSSVSPLRDSAG